MAWINFESLEFKNDLKSERTGKTFSAYILKGQKRIFGEDATEPWERMIFENTPVTVIEKGVARPNQSLLQFIQKACNPGDLLVIKFIRKNRGWEISSIENRTSNRRGALTYEPITDEELAKVKTMQMDPTRPVAPAMPTTQYMKPINYEMPTE
jgi:hypothetical protein